MDLGKQWFHNEIKDAHILFESFYIQNTSDLLSVYIFVIALCWSERGISFYQEHFQQQQQLQLQQKHLTLKGRILYVGSKTILYGLVTSLRLLYMLVVMYFNTGLFILVVTALTSAQLVIEIVKLNQTNKTVPSDKNNGNSKHSTVKGGYSDVPTYDHDNPMKPTSSALQVETDTEYDDDDDHSIPKIIVVNEKSSSSSTQSEFV